MSLIAGSDTLNHANSVKRLLSEAVSAAREQSPVAMTAPSPSRGTNLTPFDQGLPLNEPQAFVSVSAMSRLHTPRRKCHTTPDNVQTWTALRRARLFVPQHATNRLITFPHPEPRCLIQAWRGPGGLGSTPSLMQSVSMSVSVTARRWEGAGRRSRTQLRHM